jgi:N-methylhydantoinase B
MLPDLMIGCLDAFLPRGCQAESGAALWGPQFRNAPEEGERFETITVHSGGCGGRPGKDGLSATAFPTNLRTVPVEVIEAGCPLVLWRRELRPDSAGAGEFRGGYGQVIEIGHVREAPFYVAAMFDRVDNPARGRRGGRDGTTGRVSLDSGEALRPKGVQLVPRARRLRLELPGGAGLGDPRKRDRNAVKQEVAAGLLSATAARDNYDIDPQN